MFKVCTAGSLFLGLDVARAATLRGLPDPAQSPLVRRVQTLLYRGDQLGDPKSNRGCGELNDKKLLNVTPNLQLALQYTGMSWSLINSQLDNVLHDQQAFEAKIQKFQGFLGLLGWLQMMTIDQMLFEVTASSLKRLFHAYGADEKETVQFSALGEFDGLECTRANIMRLAFNATCGSAKYIREHCTAPQSELTECTQDPGDLYTNSFFLYPATFVLKKWFPDAQGWFFLREKKPEFMLWNSVSQCTKRLPKDIFNEKNPDHNVMKIKKDLRNHLLLRKNNKAPKYDFEI